MMRRFLVLLIALIAAGPAFAADPAAEDIMRRNFLVSRFADSTAAAELKLVSAQGDVRARSVTSISKLAANGVDNTRLTRFTAPAEAAGMATLTIEETGRDDKIWVYLPAMRQTRRIQAADKNKPFLGTDFSYGDVMGFRVEEWTYGPVSTDAVGGTPCFKIDAKPASDRVQASSGYALRRLWIDKQSMVALKIETYDEGGKLLKRLTAADVRLMDATGKRFQAMQLAAENVQTNHRTEIRFTSLKVNTGVADKDLTVESLEQRQ